MRNGFPEPEQAPAVTISASAAAGRAAAYAIAVTLDEVAVATAVGALAAVPLTPAVPAAEPGTTLPPRLSPVGDLSPPTLRVWPANAGPALRSVDSDRACGQVRRARAGAACLRDCRDISWISFSPRAGGSCDFGI